MLVVRRACAQGPQSCPDCCSCERVSETQRRPAAHGKICDMRETSEISSEEEAGVAPGGDARVSEVRWFPVAPGVGA